MNTPGQANQSVEDSMGQGAGEEDPSMEEILSSIRRIISDDDEGEGGEAQMPAAAEAPPVEQPAAQTPAPEAEAAEMADDVLELTDIFNEIDTEMDAEEEPAPEPEPMPAPEPEPAAETPAEPESAEAPALADSIDISEEEIDFAAAPEPQPAQGPEISETPSAPPSSPSDSDILSTDAELASAASFNKLAETILSHSRQTRTVEELIQEMLKPMLKTWLDDNLPETVERLVKEEIERVARRR